MRWLFLTIICFLTIVTVLFAAGNIETVSVFFGSVCACLSPSLSSRSISSGWQQAVTFGR